MTRGLFSATLGAVILCGFSCVGQTQSVPTEPVSHPVFPTGNGTPLGAQIADLLGDPGVSRAHWGIAVMATDGTPIYGFDEGKFFRPASNAKLFTTAAAMALLGPDVRVTTRVAAAIDLNHLQAGGVIPGDLLFAGFGDANISDRTIPYESPAARKQREAAGQALPPAPPLQKIGELATELADRGVRHITGNVVGGDTVWPWEPYPNDWTIDDAVWGYGAPVSALTINDNQIELTVTPAATAGAPATITMKPDIGYYQISGTIKTVVSEKDASVGIDRAPGSKTLQLSGSIAVGHPDTEEIAIQDPAEFAAIALKKALEAQGVQVDGKAIARHAASSEPESFSKISRTPIELVWKAPHQVCDFAFECDGYQGKTLVTISSPTLAEDVMVTLKVSQNLHAELLLHRLGKAYTGDGSTAQGARVVRQFLLNAGLDGDDFVFYDGSGLSGHDLVTPRATAQLLAYAIKQPWFAQWKAALPVGGEDGTLSSRFPDAPLKDHLFAKTGTLGESRGLSGYVDTASGKQVIFSIFVDDHAPNGSKDREVMDKIVAAIAANN